MNIKKIINNPRTTQAMLGTSKEEFERLLPLFEQTLLEIKLSNPKRKKKIGVALKRSAQNTNRFTSFTYTIEGCCVDTHKTPTSNPPPKNNPITAWFSKGYVFYCPLGLGLFNF